MPPGAASPSSRAATLTPSPWMSVLVDRHVAQIDPDAQRHPMSLGNIGVTLADRLLDLRSGAHGINDAGEFDQHAIAHQLDDAPMVH